MWWAWPTPPVCCQAPGIHSQVVLPCMLTTHLASWLVSRALKGRTLTATFTEAPVMASDTPTLLSWRSETQEVVRASGGTQTLTPSFSKEPVSPPLFTQLPNPPRTQFLVPWPSSQMSLSSGTPKGIVSHIPARSYLLSWPQTRGAVSVLASTGPRRGSPILHLGPGHTSWGGGGNPGCGGRVVRRHL